jgi:IS5 family transposase
VTNQAIPRSNAGRKPYEVTLMFEMPVLQSLYNLFDGQAEFQVRDRLSLQRFLGLLPEDTVPDADTLRLFREQLTRQGLIDRLFASIRRATVAVGADAVGWPDHRRELGQRAEES